MPVLAQRTMYFDCSGLFQNPTYILWVYPRTGHNDNTAVCLPYKPKIRTTMGQQHRKETKRRRRTAYIKRQKEIAKNSKNTTPVQMAKKVSKD